MCLSGIRARLKNLVLRINLFFYWLLELIDFLIDCLDVVVVVVVVVVVFVIVVFVIVVVVIVCPPLSSFAERY